MRHNPSALSEPRALVSEPRALASGKTLSTCLLLLASLLILPASLAQQQSKDLIKPPERILSVRSLAFSPDGKHLAGSSGLQKDQGEVVLWDAKTRKVRWTHKVEKGVPAITFSPDGKTLAAGSMTEHCILLDADTGKVQATLPGHAESARSLAFSPDGLHLAVGSYDSKIRIWNWREKTVTKILDVQKERIYSLAYLQDGKVLASGPARGPVCLWDTVSDKVLHNWKNGRWQMAGDPKGRWLAIAGTDYSLTIRSLENYESDLAYYDGVRAFNILVFHPSAESFAAQYGFDNTIRIFPLDLRQPTPADEKRIRELMALWDDDAFAVRENASRDLAKMGNVTKPLLTKAAAETQSAEFRIRSRELLRILGLPKPLAELRPPA